MRNTHRFAIRTMVAMTLAMVGTGALSLGAGCGDDLSETGTVGQRVALETRVTSDDELAAPFMNALGWTIELTQVLVSTGPMYYFDGEPPQLAQRDQRVVPWRRWLVGVAIMPIRGTTIPAMRWGRCSSLPRSIC